MIKGLLFDMDGVVIDSESFNDKACALLLSEFGKTYDRDFLKPKMAGKSDLDGMTAITKHYKLPISGMEFNLRRKKIKLQFYETEINYMKGFESFFSGLIKKFKCPAAIVTASSKEYFDLVDKRLKISKKFGNNIFRTEMIGKHKPEPDVYLFAGKKLKVPCSECLVFEDSPAGVVSGYRAKAKVIALTSTFSKKVLINNIKEIEPSINIKDILFINKFSEESLKKVVEFSLK